MYTASNNWKTTALAVVLVVMAASWTVDLVEADAGHFFAQTPKHIPRIGRRSSLPTPTVEDRGAVVFHEVMSELMAQLDADGNGCVNVEELVEIPSVRTAIIKFLNLMPTRDEEAETAQEEPRERAVPRLWRLLGQ